MLSRNRLPTIAQVAVPLGGGLMAIGSFMPWIFAGGGFVSEVVAGIRTDEGAITLALGLALVVLGLVMLRLPLLRWASWLGFGIALSGLAAVIITFATMQERWLGGEVREYVEAGEGLYLTLAGAVLSAGAALLTDRADGPVAGPRTVVRELSVLAGSLWLTLAFLSALVALLHNLSALSLLVIVLFVLPALAISVLLFAKPGARLSLVLSAAGGTVLSFVAVLAFTTATPRFYVEWKYLFAALIAAGAALVSVLDYRRGTGHQVGP
jgi:hypothetical protein